MSTEPEVVLTAEQQVEIAKAATAQAQAETAKAVARTAELENEARHLRARDTVKKQINGVAIKSFHKPEELLVLLRQEPGTTIEPDATGENLIVTVDGRESSMEEIVKDYAIKHSSEFDKRTMRGLLPDDDAEKVLSRSDLRDSAAVRQFIRVNGLSAYESLPVSRPRTLDPSKLTREDWAIMRVEEKNRVIANSPDGELVVSRILKRSREKK
jgi:hypothetical protein